MNNNNLEIKSKILDCPDLTEIEIPDEGNSITDELLARIRNIRFSEKEIWKEILEIFKTSIDFKGENDQKSDYFLANMQNKVHYAIHGHTAAEIIYERADATKPYMGLQTWEEDTLNPGDTTIAKNYLTENELEKLSFLTNVIYDFVTILAKKNLVLSMQGWNKKINMLLELFGFQVKADDYYGTCSREEAYEHALSKYQEWISSQNFPIEDIDF